MSNSAPVAEQDSDNNRFVIRDARGTAELRYNVVGSRIILEHTEVPKALQGRGLAGALARTALEYARAKGLTVIPVCPYVIGYLARHPEYQALLDRPPRAQVRDRGADEED